MVGLKYSILGTIARNIVPYHCSKEIENFESLLSDMHQKSIRASLN